MYFIHDGEVGNRVVYNAESKRGGDGGWGRGRRDCLCITYEK